MAILLFILLQITVLLILRSNRLESLGCLFYVIAYPVWFVASFMYCLEVIPYHPNYPRFNGIFEGFSDYLMLFSIWICGFLLIPLITLTTFWAIGNLSNKQIGRVTIGFIILLIFIATWGWLGVYSTPDESKKLFIKYNPTIKLVFKTTFHEHINYSNKEKLESITDEDILNEELKFIEYVSNREFDMSNNIPMEIIDSTVKLK